MAKPTRKIIQLMYLEVPGSGHASKPGNARIFVLCDDGSVWWQSITAGSNTWQQIDVSRVESTEN